MIQPNYPTILDAIDWAFLKHQSEICFGSFVFDFSKKK